MTPKQWYACDGDRDPRRMIEFLYSHHSWLPGITREERVRRVEGILIRWIEACRYIANPAKDPRVDIWAGDEWQRMRVPLPARVTTWADFVHQGHAHLTWAMRCSLLRDVVDPFYDVPLIYIDHSDRERLLHMVRDIHREHRWDELPILADYLEDCGVTNTYILNHLRDPNQVHCQGCLCLRTILWEA